MKDGFLLDDWGPVPDPMPTRWEGVRAAGEALSVAVVFTLGMLSLLVGVAVYLIVLPVLLCMYAAVTFYQAMRRAFGP